MTPLNIQHVLLKYKVKIVKVPREPYVLRDPGENTPAARACGGVNYTVDCWRGVAIAADLYIGIYTVDGTASVRASLCLFSTCYIQYTYTLWQCAQYKIYIYAASAISARVYT